MVQNTHDAIKTVNLDETVMTWYVQVHWCSMILSSVETKSAADIMGRPTEFKRKQVTVGFADFQRHGTAKAYIHCSSECFYPLGGGGGGLKREGKRIE